MNGSGVTVWAIAAEADVPPDSSVTLQRCSFVRNLAGSDGGQGSGSAVEVKPVFFEPDRPGVLDVVISECTFEENLASQSGGAVYIGSTNFYGTASIAIADSTFSRNEAGHVFGRPRDGTGGAVAIEFLHTVDPGPLDVHLEVTGSTFEANHAESGGSALVLSAVDDATFVMADSTVTDGTTGTEPYGAQAFFAKADATLSGVDILRNDATSWGATYFGLEFGYTVTLTEVDFGIGVDENRGYDMYECPEPAHQGFVASATLDASNPCP
jgi:predicted outer membrane repeat protein